MLSDKQGGMKYHFLSLWYDSIWDWTPVSRTIDEHSNHYVNENYKLFRENQVSVLNNVRFDFFLINLYGLFNAKAIFVKEQ